jgi:hypothetical protein
MMKTCVWIPKAKPSVGSPFQKCLSTGKRDSHVNQLAARSCPIVVSLMASNLKIGPSLDDLRAEDASENLLSIPVMDSEPVTLSGDFGNQSKGEGNENDIMESPRYGMQAQQVPLWYEACPSRRVQPICHIPPLP